MASSIIVSISSRSESVKRDVDGTEAVLDMADLPSTDDRDVYGGVRQRPRDGQLADGDPAVGGELLQCAHRRQVAPVRVAGENRTRRTPVIRAKAVWALSVPVSSP